MTTFISPGQPSVKVSVEPSVRVYVMGTFGKVQSSAKTLAFIVEKSYINA
jgi:hypothetical protein